jgi:hypothetical protein
MSNWVNNRYEFSAMGKSKTFGKIMAVSKRAEFTNYLILLTKHDASVNPNSLGGLIWLTS